MIKLARTLGLLLTLAVSLGTSAAPFATRDSALLDASGAPFILRGVNRVHPDSWGTAADVARMGANAIRIAFNFTKSPTANLAMAQSYAAAGIVPIAGNWMGTCKSDPASLVAIVDTWVAQADTWTQLNDVGMINIANEWGPSDSAVWRDSYIAAVARMRDAGYTGTLIIDSGYCGQDSKDIIKYGALLLDSDPEHNLLFSVHVYGAFHFPATASWQQDYTKAFAALKATGLPILIGEFGPGRNVGPSPTMVPPWKVVRDAEANGWGWLAWATDDGNLPGCTADDNWFSMTRKCGLYSGAAADLTTFGQQMVPLFQVLARPALRALPQ